MKILIALSLILLTGCASCPVSSEKCAPQTTRCQGNMAELCAPSGHWVLLIDCSTLTGGDWTCATVDIKHVCLLRK